MIEQRTVAQLVEAHGMQRAALASAKAEIQKIQEFRATLLLRGTVDEIIQLDDEIRHVTIEAEIAQAKVQALNADLYLARAEAGRWSGVAMPSDSELAKLLEIVVASHPWLDFPPKDNNSSISRDYKREFKTAFYGVGHMRRLSEPTQKLAFHSHVASVNILLRRHHSDVEGDAVMAAILAWNDVPFRPADSSLGQLLEVGLDLYSGSPANPEAWRGLLRGEPLLEPLPPRGVRELPGRPIPQVSFYQQDSVTGQMLRVPSQVI